MLGLKIGTSQLLRAYVGDKLVWNWTPSQLLAGKEGFWLGERAFHENRLFRESTAASPVTAFGQFVGRATRKAGTVDALQATALSRPAIGRWPKGEKARNFLRGVSDYSNDALWLPSVTRLGASSTKTAVAGEVVYTMAGELTANTAFAVTPFFSIPYKTGEKYTASIEGRMTTDLVGLTGVDGVRIVYQFHDASGAVIQNAAVPAARSEDYTRGVVEITTDDPTVTELRVITNVRFPLGAVLDNTVVGLRNFQLERGSVATTYQPTDADGVPLAGYGQVRNLLDYNEVLTTGLGGIIVNAWAAWGASVEAVPEVWDGYRGIKVNSLGETFHRVHTLSGNRLSSLAGETFTLTAIIKRGSIGSHAWVVFRNEGIVNRESSVLIDFNTSTVVSVGTAAGPVSNPTVEVLEGGVYRVSFTVTVLADGDPVRVGAGPYSATVGDNIIVFAMQCERGPVATPMQRTVGPNNVSEPNVPDVPFLFNDGNDSLPATLPAGTYGIAWVNVAGGVTFTTQTLASAGTIDALQGLRTVDAIIRQGDFTSEEKGYLERFWGSIAA